jgi:ABC-type transport system substrate-binding protein
LTLVDGRPNSWANTPEGGSYTVGIVQSATHHNPLKHMLTEAESELGTRPFIPSFAKLYTMAEPTDTLIPFLATSEPLIEDETCDICPFKANVHLQSDILWSDGEHMTVDDVKYSFDLFKHLNDHVPSDSQSDYAKRIHTAIGNMTLSILNSTTVHFHSRSRPTYEFWRPILQMPIFAKHFWHAHTHPNAGNPTALSDDINVLTMHTPLAAPFKYGTHHSNDMLQVWETDKHSSLYKRIAYTYCDGGGVTVDNTHNHLTQMHYGPFVDSVVYKSFSDGDSMFAALERGELNHAIHGGSNWEGIPAKTDLTRQGFVTYRAAAPAHFNLHIDQGPDATNFPANNKIFRQSMACAIEKAEIFDTDPMLAGGRGRYYDDVFEELTNADGMYDHWKEIGWTPELSGVLKTCGDLKAVGMSGQHKDRLDAARDILKKGGWEATDWGGQNMPGGNFLSDYSPIVNLTYNGKSLPDTMRLYVPNVKPYRELGTFLMQMSLQKLGLNAVATPRAFMFVNYCHMINDAFCNTDDQQFRVGAFGEKYPFTSDIPSYARTMFSSDGQDAPANDHPYDAEVHALASAYTFEDVKAAARHLQTKLYEDIPMLSMFKFNHREVFYKTMLPYEKVYFGSFHLGTTWGGFASTVKVYH